MRNSKSKIDADIALAHALLRTDPSKAEKLADQAFKQSQTNQYLKGQADAQVVYAHLLAKTEPNTAFEFAQKAIEVYRCVGDLFSESGALMVVARHYENNGWTTRSHYVLQEACEKARLSSNSKIEVVALFNLGANAEDRQDYPMALTYFASARIAADKIGNLPIFWRATCAEHEMRFEAKDDFFDVQSILDAVAFFESQKMDSSIGDILRFLARVASHNSEHRIARFYLRRAFRLAKEANDAQAQAEIIGKLGEFKLLEGRTKSAQKLLEKAISMSQALGVSSLEFECTKFLARAKAARGVHYDAFNLMDNYVEKMDVLYAQESQKHFDEIKNTHQVHLLEEESKALRQTNSDLSALNERLEAALIEKQILQKELERLATTDELTGALNRREAMAFGAEIVSRFHSQGRPGVVMIVDIDHFKTINDSFGHSAGDEVLRRFTKACHKVLRPTDRFGRLGGEEFCILLDRTDLEIAMKVAERVMNSIRACRVADILGERIVTASIGIVAVNRSHETIEAALHDADLGLYEAKRTGRDKICVTGVKKRKAA